MTNVATNYTKSLDALIAKVQHNEANDLVHQVFSVQELIEERRRVEDIDQRLTLLEMSSPSVLP